MKEKSGVMVCLPEALESLHESRYRDSFKGVLPIRVSELRKLIYEKVRTFTRGMQNPTSRQENGWWDWEL